MDKYPRQDIPRTKIIIPERTIYWVNNAVVLQIEQQAIEYTAERGHSDASFFCEKEYRIDNDQWIKYGIDTFDSTCYVDKDGYQCHIAYSLHVYIDLKAFNSFQEEKV